MPPVRAGFIARMRAAWTGYKQRRWIPNRRPWRTAPLDPSRSDERRLRQIKDGQLTASNGLVVS